MQKGFVSSCAVMTTNGVDTKKSRGNTLGYAFVNSRQSCRPNGLVRSNPPSTAPAAPPSDDEQATDPTTKPSEDEKTEIDSSAEELSDYEAFQAMSAEEQQAFIATFEDMDAFFEWYNRVKEAYEAANPPIEIGDGDVDMGDIIGGND